MALNVKVLKYSTTYNSSYSSASLVPANNTGPSSFSYAYPIFSLSSTIYTVPSGRVAKVALIGFNLSANLSGYQSNIYNVSGAVADIIFNGWTLNDSNLFTNNYQLLLNSSAYSNTSYSAGSGAFSNLLTGFVAPVSNSSGFTGNVYGTTTFSLNFQKFASNVPMILSQYINEANYGGSYLSNGNGSITGFSQTRYVSVASLVNNILMGSGESLNISVSLLTGIGASTSGYSYSGSNSGGGFNGTNYPSLSIYTAITATLSYSILVIEESAT